MKMFEFEQCIKCVYYVLLSFVLMKIVKWLIGYYMSLRVINKIKGPPYLPLIGNSHQLQTKEGLLYQQIEFSKIYKDELFYRFWTGPQPFVMFHKADALEV